MSNSLNKAWIFTLVRSHGIFGNIFNMSRKATYPNEMWMTRCSRYSVKPNSEDATVKPSNAELETQKLKMIKMEYEIQKLRGGKCPTVLTDEAIAKLMMLPTTSQRRKYLYSLYKKEKYKLEMAECKELRRKTILEKLREKELKEADDHIQYRIGKNTIFFRIGKTTINLVDYYRLMYCVQFGQSIVFDMGFEETMDEKEATLTASQLKTCYSLNKRSDEPFYLHLCNVDRGAKTFSELQKQLPIVENHKFLGRISENCFLDTFPRNKLVYLSPNAKNELVDYDHDAVYIIGSVVERSAHKPLSLSRAKLKNVKIARLPIDRYLDWGPGNTKSLSLNLMMQIMLEMKLTQDWNKAFQVIPKWKVKDSS